MSLTQKNLAFIQRAGQSVHGAAEAVTATVRIQAESMVSRMASQPFGVESEQAIARFKLLARLSQGLVAVETQLQELYAIASDLANPASDVVIALPSLSKRQTTNAAAVDVVAKPAKAKAKAKKSGRKPATAGKLSPNDAKLLQYLQGALTTDSWTAQTGAMMAAGSGLPLGSVGVSLRKVLGSGSVIVGERGKYQLSASATGAQIDVTPSAVKPAASTTKKVGSTKSKGAPSKAVKVKSVKSRKSVAAQKSKKAPSKATSTAAPVPEESAVSTAPV